MNTEAHLDLETAVTKLRNCRSWEDLFVFLYLETIYRDCYKTSVQQLSTEGLIWANLVA